ncbi:hypothetical protein JHD50_09190 [Sulfurimonas sp. MAG313]|nr:hypothetical protein [Sulfurimonas sp. MAG313]MDF1881472.1 hypothetical protein [Sulfurimonas sp. MAG313]
MKQAFSLLELFITITLFGVMAIFISSFIDVTHITKSNVKTQLQAHFNAITSSILYCQSLTNSFPIQNDGSLANNTLLSILECNTSTPYLLDGGKGSFVPPALTGMTEYTATEIGTEFYFLTTASVDSLNDEALTELNASYSANQYVLTSDATTTTLKFYLSR